jgi:hypothetical protein
VAAFRHGWLVIAAVMVAGGATALLLHGRTAEPRQLPELPPSEPDLVGEVAV